MLLIFATLGCQEDDPQKTAAPATELEGRLSAALAMSPGIPRHNTLVQCATAAANGGEGDVVLKAIGAIDRGVARDNLCAACSQTLGPGRARSAAGGGARRAAISPRIRALRPRSPLASPAARDKGGRSGARSPKAQLYAASPLFIT